MHTVEKTDTYTNQDGTKSTFLTAGDVIADEDAADLGLISAKDAAKDESKSAGAAPENKSAR